MEYVNVASLAPNVKTLLAPTLLGQSFKATSDTSRASLRNH